METQDQILIYSSEDGKTQVSVQLKGKNIWLTQRQMGELFDTDSDTIGLHLKNIYRSGEFQREATTQKYSVVQIEGDRQIKSN
ncbi:MULTISPECIES: death-on-curing protein [unclassified Arenibacter]|uniref:death-on-curing protein n=1 Tax=unclassified Arenibacter TaxID=2615047 RepID=UPI000E347C6C|nr:MULTISPECIES: death-on-curing protein [unclassified Arenibacter]MCM4165141.1 death-on-curing protein [Arenibacter sp. A80]RFT55006.1 death-on-curing protein [Arenibacter sp. P308M17]